MTITMTENARLRAALAYISTAGSGQELYPVGPSHTDYTDDGQTVVRHTGPWFFQYGVGDTFLDAVEDDMRKAANPL